MRLKGKKITFGITGSIHVIKQVVPQIQNLIKEGADIIPIMSFNYGEVKEEISGESGGEKEYEQWFSERFGEET